MSKCYITIWIILVVLATGSFKTTNSVEVVNCEKNNKTCVIITDCTSALDLLKKKAYEPLRNMFCGFDTRGPKVCCPILDETVTNNVIVNILPSRTVCGKSKASQDRIIGGNITLIEEFPWMVQIKSRISRPRNKNTEEYRCAGSLISDRYVLTAAHCTFRQKLIHVRLGEWDTETARDCYQGVCNDPPVDVNITKVIMHPLYDPTTFKNDISILKLEKAVEFTDFIQPICLPITKYAINQDYIVGTTYWTAGWGVTELSVSQSVVKRKVDLDAVSLEYCFEKFPSAVNANKGSIICAGNKVGKDSCNGDSGGPLLREISEDSQVNWYLYGITSFGPKVCGNGIPGVYTRVTSFMDWIKSNIAP